MFLLSTVCSSFFEPTKNDSGKIYHVAIVQFVDLIIRRRHGRSPWKHLRDQGLIKKAFHPCNS